MFDVGWSEFLLVAVVALIVIGPKDLPKAMRVLGYWVGRARGVARQFRSGFDNMVREAELEEMEKRWAEENARIMREHSVGALTGSPLADPVSGVVAGATAAAPTAALQDPEPSPAFDPSWDQAPAPLPEHATEPVHVEKPEIRPAPGEARSPRGDGVTS